MKCWMARSAGLGVALCVGVAGVLNAADEAPKTTLDNVKAAYGNELNAKAEYEAFAAKADEEGYKSVAALFRAAAKSEAIHAAKHEAILKDLKVEVKAEGVKPAVKTTKENLETTVKDKTALNETVHPAYVKQAETDKNEKAVMSFKGAMAANTEYVKLCKDAAANLDAWKAAGKEFYVCLVCSFVMTDPKLEKCPICAAPRAKFEVFK